MHHFDEPAEVLWHLDEEEPPADWSQAVPFPTLREALQSVIDGAPQTGHPWARCNGRIYAPREIEELWLGDGGV